MTASAISILNNSLLRNQLLSKVSDEIAEIDTDLRELTSSVEPLVTKVTRHTLDAGGKRLRPAFVALAGRACNEDASKDRLRTLGACMEMIHMATLIHDDVIDNSATRRGRPTASAEFGNTASILSGDVLLAKSMAVMAKDRDFKNIEIVSAAMVEMAEGEVRELSHRNDFDLEESVHLEILRMKTASFIKCCCELGANTAGATPEQVNALGEYGYHVGMAFQIADDILDYRGDKAKTGKPIATDFREGQATLPLIRLRSKLSEAECQIARRRFGGNVNEDEIRMICDWMHTRNCFGECEMVAREHIEKSQEALQVLPHSDSRDMLEAVSDYVLLRQS